MRPTRVTAPADLITLDEAREQCRVDGSDENSLLQRAIDAAVSYLDGYTGVLGRCIVEQTWRIHVTRPGRTVLLPFPDIISVTAEFTDTEGGQVPVDLSDSCPAANFGRVYGRPLAITFKAGFGPIEAVPPAIKQSALMLVDFFYSQRGGQSDGPGIPPEVDAMISPFRVWRI